MKECFDLHHAQVIKDARGSLSILESGKQVPFDIKRIFFVTNVPKNEIRGGHAHKNLKQFVLCMSGSFKLLLDDGNNRVCRRLVSDGNAILIPPMYWAEQYAFSKGAVMAVLASDFYDEKDYIRSYSEFLRLMGKI